jgi:uncharacterized membrane protein YGL010W
MESFQSHQRHYREHHKTLGCKITHMIGVPMIALSIPVLFIHWQWAIALFVIGWIFQFIGHYVFEKNKPVFMNDPQNPLTYFSAIFFVADEWWHMLTGKPANPTSQIDEQSK